MSKQEEPMLFHNYNHLRTPKDTLKYVERLGGICGEAAIAALLDCEVKTVFAAWGINESDFRGWTLQKEMRRILDRLGYDCKQKSVEDKKKLPDSDFAIVRVSFGKPDQHWAKTASLSHYIALRRFVQGWYVYDSAISMFDGKPINGLWIEKSEYCKVIEAEDMFITSYLEVTMKVTV